ncbi:flagellar hook-length control protein FliK [Sphingomonas sp. 1P08PE]|uniref:flagellar hook-length control protein FliK n=1 Tax=Sphingomonas sp. 1P08PE TaxID=554122 RepID=UPI0039A3C011
MISLAASLPTLAAPPRGTAPVAVGAGAALPFALPEQGATMAAGIALAAVLPAAPAVALALPDRQADAADGEILPDDLLALLPPAAVADATSASAPGGPVALPDGVATPATPQAFRPGRPAPGAPMITAGSRFAPPTVPASPLASDAAETDVAVVEPDALPITTAVVVTIAAALQPIEPPAPPEPIKAEPVGAEPVRAAPATMESPAAKPVTRAVRREASDRPLRRERADAAPPATADAPAAVATAVLQPLPIAVAAADIVAVSTSQAVTPGLPPLADPVAAPGRPIAAATPPIAASSATLETVAVAKPVDEPAAGPAPASAAPTAPIASAPTAAPAAANIAAPVTARPLRKAPEQARDPSPAMAPSSDPQPLAPATRLPAGVTVIAPATTRSSPPTDSTRVAEPTVPWRFAATTPPAAPAVGIAPPGVPVRPVDSVAIAPTTTVAVDPLPGAVQPSSAGYPTAPAPAEASRPTAAATNAQPSAAASSPPAPPPILAAAPAAAVFAPAIAAADEQDRRQPRIAGAMDVASPGAVAAAPTVAAPLAADTAGQAPLDLSQPRWPQAMVDRIEALRDAADANDTRIRLVPDALGAIDIGLTREGDTIHVRFTAEQAQTRALLQEAQPRLAEAADQRGLKLGQTSVEATAAAQSQTQQQGSQQNQQQSPSTPSGGTAAQSHAAGSQAQAQGQGSGRQSQPAVPTRPAGAATTTTAAQADDDARIA